MIALLSLLACDGSDTDGRGTFDPPFDPQLQPDFVDDLAHGFACPFGQTGPVDGALLMDDDATVRVQIQRSPDGVGYVVVFLGERLDAVFADDNACDDVVAMGPEQQSIRMAYSASPVDYVATDGPDGRTIALGDLLLGPDVAYAEYADFTVEDAALVEPVSVAGWSVGPIAIGGVFAEVPVE